MKGDIFKNKMQALLEMRAERDVERDGASEWEWVRERVQFSTAASSCLCLCACARARVCAWLSEGTWSGSRLQDCLIAFLQVCRQQNCLTAATTEIFVSPPLTPLFQLSTSSLQETSWCVDFRFRRRRLHPHLWLCSRRDDSCGDVMPVNSKHLTGRL